MWKHVPIPILGPPDQGQFEDTSSGKPGQYALQSQVKGDQTKEAGRHHEINKKRISPRVWPGHSDVTSQWHVGKWTTSELTFTSDNMWVLMKRGRPPILRIQGWKERQKRFNSQSSEEEGQLWNEACSLKVPGCALGVNETDGDQAVLQLGKGLMRLQISCQQVSSSHVSPGMEASAPLRTSFLIVTLSPYFGQATTGDRSMIKWRDGDASWEGHSGVVERKGRHGHMGHSEKTDTLWVLQCEPWVKGMS